MKFLRSKIIDTHLDQTRIDSIIVEKNKTAPSVQEEGDFYPRMMGYLVGYIINGYDLSLFEKVIVFTDSLPVKKKRKAIEKSIKQVLSQRMPANLIYCIYHHASKSNYDLQIVDYCNWAIYRKWENGDYRSYDIIKKVIFSEFDIFRKGKTLYY